MGAVLMVVAATGWWLCTLKIDPYLTPDARTRMGRVGGIEYLSSASYSPEGRRFVWWVRLASLATTVLFFAGFLWLI